MSKFTVGFYNSGNKSVIIKSRDGRIKETIPVGVSTKVKDVKIGDVFDVQMKDEPRLVFRPIFINSSKIKEDIKIYGNTPFQKLSLWNPPLRLVDFEANLYGVDFTTFNPRLVVTSFSKKSIFEGLGPNSVDYDFQAGNVLKAGMTYSATNLSQGSNDVRMAYGYSSFSQDWNVNLGIKGTVPVKGVDVSGSIDFGYSQFEKTERESTNVYAYTREQKAVYEIGLDPREAYLDPDFIIAVNSIKSVKDAEEKIIPLYGTHYPTKVYYGGDRSAFVSMSRTSYAKLKGMNVNVKATVAASTEQITSRKVTGKSETNTFGSGEVASGSLGFGFSQNQEAREIFEHTKTGYQAIGGEGGFDTWSVTPDNAVPVAVELDLLYNLIEPEIFKDGTPPEKLAEKQRFIKQAISAYLKQMQQLEPPLPSPREYSITLDKLEVTEAVDDLNQATKGSVRAIVAPTPPEFEDVLWNQGDYNTNLPYAQGTVVYPGSKKTFVQLPSTKGTFDEPLEVQIAIDIYEKDDHAPFDHFAERHTATSSPVSISKLAEGETQQITCDAGAFTSWAERGNIRATATARREPSEFIKPLFKR